MRTSSARPGMLLSALALLCISQSALADGKMFRHQTVTADPTIRAQRAAIFYKDGIETLIVESDLENAEGEMGWILPLPAPPTKIEACEPYALAGLARHVQPEVVRLDGALPLGAMGLFVIVTLYTIHSYRSRTRKPQPFSPIRISLVLAVFIPVWAVLLLPSLSGRAAPRITEVDILHTGRAGVYDITVLRSQNASAVTDWLDSNGFAWTPDAAPVLAEYVADGWCFVASRLAADQAGQATHHPLSFTFPADEAIYPMRLTGVGAEPMDLDLFVIGDRGAAVAGMETWVADQCRFDDDTTNLATFAGSPSRRAHAASRGFRFGMPDIVNRMWPRCVLTRLHSRLGPGDMQHDLAITWRDGPAAMRKRVFSRKTAFEIGGSAALFLMAGLVAFFAIRGYRQQWTLSRLVRQRGLVVMTLSLAGGAACYAWCDIVSVTEVTRRSFIPRIVAHKHVGALLDLTEITSDAPFPETYRVLLDEQGMDEFGISSKTLRKVGDYRIVEEETGWKLTVLGYYDTPATIMIDSNSQPVDRPE